MKETIGGTYLLYIFMFFFVIYVLFIAFGIKYAQAFKVKNYIINVLEEGETCIPTTEMQDDISAYMSQTNYTQLSKNGYNYSSYNIEVYSDTQGDISKGTYCKVETSFELEFPFFKLRFTVPLRGTTRLLVDNVD